MKQAPESRPALSGKQSQRTRGTCTNTCTHTCGSLAWTDATREMGCRKRCAAGAGQTLPAVKAVLRCKLCPCGAGAQGQRTCTALCTQGQSLHRSTALTTVLFPKQTSKKTKAFSVLPGAAAPVHEQASAPPLVKRCARVNSHIALRNYIEHHPRRRQCPGTLLCRVWRLTKGVGRGLRIVPSISLAAA